MFQNTRIEIEGRLGRDPELKHVGAKNTPLCSSTVAIQIGKRDDNNTLWMDIKAWEYAASVLAGLKKGDLVNATGYLTQEQWEKDGETKKKTVMIADRFRTPLFAAKEQGDGGYNPPPAYARKEAPPEAIVSGTFDDSSIPF